MKISRHTATIPSILALAIGLPFAAVAQKIVDAGEISLDGWSYDALYDPEAWSVGDFFGAAVYDPDNNEIGGVEDVVFNDSGELLAIIAEVGGFWDIGDTHVSVPWEETTIHDNGRIEIPLTEAVLEDYDLFDYSGLPGTALAEDIVAEVDEEPLGYRVWRASELMGDYVRIQDEDSTWINYGTVTDIIVRDAQIVGTIVNTSYQQGAGRVAFPYTPTTPGGIRAPSVDLPVLMGDAEALPLFDPGQVDGG
jgi:sporulation protein YlmC with PRC-barrel domain